MITKYIKQAWQMMRQNKLFSGIYILGTALAIASTSIFAIVYYVKLAPVYPEYKRDKLSELAHFEYDLDDGYRTSSPGVSRMMLNDFFAGLDDVEEVSGYIQLGTMSFVMSDMKGVPFEGVKRYTDPAFFKIIDYEFVAGAPFSQAEFDSGVAKAVISDVVADYFYASPEEAIGKTIEVDFIDYEICGVYREGSSVNRLSYAQIIVPYTTTSLANYVAEENQTAGVLSLIIQSDNLPGVKAAVEDYCRKYEAANDGKKIYMRDQPRSAAVVALSPDERDEFDLMKVVRYNCLVLLALLIVPALNLSGLIAGRMDSRSGELGVRKSFGATGGRLMSQVLWENLLLTLVGGALGLLITWLILSTNATAIFTSIGGSSMYSEKPLEINLTPDM
ncbi:MAG: ABC transporter permease, partial [Muribaculaceae bacterium]|nr:ABC transporter permease [Muribaculaceae bacterium]